VVGVSLSAPWHSLDVQNRPLRALCAHIKQEIEVQHCPEENPGLHLPLSPSLPTYLLSFLYLCPNSYESPHLDTHFQFIVLHLSL